MKREGERQKDVWRERKKQRRREKERD